VSHGLLKKQKPQAKRHAHIVPAENANRSFLASVTVVPPGSAAHCIGKKVAAHCGSWDVMVVATIRNHHATRAPSLSARHPSLPLLPRRPGLRLPFVVVGRGAWCWPGGVH